MSVRYGVIVIVMLAMLSIAKAGIAGEQADRPSAGLQDRMSYSQFRKLGLDHLSADQLAGLNAWLKTHGDCGPGMSSPAPARVSDSGRDKQPPSHFRNRIAGDFSGWNQDTVLTLQNGQRWRVTDDEPMHVATLHDPQVSVWKGFFNTWLLSVDGLDNTVHVVPVD